LDQVHIGTPETFVALAPAGRVMDAWPVDVAIVAGAFRGGFRAELDMRAFRQALERLYDTLEGSASLHCGEGSLDIEVTCAGPGRIRVSAKARPSPHNAELQLSEEIDQSYLPAILSAIDRLFLSPANEPD